MLSEIFIRMSCSVSNNMPAAHVDNGIFRAFPKEMRSLNIVFKNIFYSVHILLTFVHDVHILTALQS